MLNFGNLMNFNHTDQTALQNSAIAMPRIQTTQNGANQGDRRAAFSAMLDNVF